MIQLSDYDYPIIVNPFHFIGYFREMSDAQYSEIFKIKVFFQEIIKNGILFEKESTIAPLMKRYSILLNKPVCGD